MCCMTCRAPPFLHVSQIILCSCDSMGVVYEHLFMTNYDISYYLIVINILIIPQHMCYIHVTSMLYFLKKRPLDGAKIIYYYLIFIVGTSTPSSPVTHFWKGSTFKRQFNNLILTSTEIRTRVLRSGVQSSTTELFSHIYICVGKMGYLCYAYHSMSVAWM